MNGRGQKKNGWSETDQIKEKTEWKILYNHTVLLKPRKHSATQHRSSFLAKIIILIIFLQSNIPQSAPRLHQTLIFWALRPFGSQWPWTMLVSLVLKRQTSLKSNSSKLSNELVVKDISSIQSSVNSLAGGRGKEHQTSDGGRGGGGWQWEALCWPFWIQSSGFSSVASRSSWSLAGRTQQGCKQLLLLQLMNLTEIHV